MKDQPISLKFEVAELTAERVATLLNNLIDGLVVADAHLINSETSFEKRNAVGLSLLAIVGFLDGLLVDSDRIKTLGLLITALMDIEKGNSPELFEPDNSSGRPGTNSFEMHAKGQAIFAREILVASGYKKSHANKIVADTFNLAGIYKNFRGLKGGLKPKRVNDWCDDAKPVTGSDSFLQGRFKFLHETIIPELGELTKDKAKQICRDAASKATNALEYSHS